MVTHLRTRHDGRARPIQHPGRFDLTGEREELGHGVRLATDFSAQPCKTYQASNGVKYWRTNLKKQHRYAVLSVGIPFAAVGVGASAITYLVKQVPTAASQAVITL
jgi:hypothetical protein